MKKFYLLCLLGLSAAALHAQSSLHLADKNNMLSKINTTPSLQSGVHTGTNQPTAVLWSDDFSTPSNWVLTHDSGTVIDWVIGTDVPSGNFPIPAIQSVTMANGYALFDSDFYCDTANGQVANLTNAFPIDLTGHDSIRLTFSQYYKRFFDSTYVYISNDGSTWTRFEVNAGLTNNSFSANNGLINPDIVNLDISSVAGNQDTVYIRFQFYSPNSLSIQAGCGYSWMIDDVSLSDFPAFDGTLDRAFAGEYSMIPVIQPEAFTLRGKIVNKGLASFTGAKILFNVYDPLFAIAYQDSTAATGTVNPGDTTGFLLSLGTYMPPDTGLYIIDQIVVVPGDGDNSNDTTTAFIYVSDSIYARDFLDFDISTYAGRLGLQGAPVSFGSVYTVYHPSEFSSATFYLAQPTLGDQISVSVYDMSGGTPVNEIGASAVYTITAADTGGTSYITLPFSPPVSVGAGNFLVAINQLDTNRLTLGYTSYISTPSNGYLNIDGGGWITFDSLNFDLAPILRVNNPSGTLVHVKSPEKSSRFNVYPNPSAGVVHFTGAAGQVEKNVSVRIINNLGEVVRTYSFNSISHGRLDLSTLPAGMYSMAIRSGTAEEIKTIVIQ